MSEMEIILCICMAVFVAGAVLMFVNFKFMEGIFRDEVLEDWCYFFPSHIYQRSDMNYFGAILVFLLILVVNYLYCACALIAWSVYKITHVGRRK